MDLPQLRVKSFNPKAAPFSPTFATPKMEKARIVLPIPTPAPNLLKDTSEVYDPFVTDRELDDSPLWMPENMQSSFSPVPVRIEDLLNRNMPLETLVKMLEGQ